ncbi:MAG: aldehyde dehydrogenase family protein [Ketobacteraceae bacterium]|nr:aldehyde dehydrogenase family protein [Ketobacteraceae bacterium]
MDSFDTISPIDNRILLTTSYATESEIQGALKLAGRAQARWRQTSLKERAEICRKALSYFSDNEADISREITLQMGRPIRFGPGEIAGLQERGHYMIEIAERGLADLDFGDKAGFKRYIRREPVGLVFVLAPWNYPYLTAVNSIIPAIMAGNAVLLKHSAQTPLCADRFYQAFQSAGLPEGVFQYLQLSHAQMASLIQSPGVHYVAFTGSVEGGRKVETAASGRFIGVGLELGGKDPAYVRADADLEYSIEGLVDGAFFNSGQSCCGIERIYVADALYDRFVKGFVARVEEYVLGDPLDQATTLGPVVSVKAADAIQTQIEAAIAAGAEPCVHADRFSQPTDVGHRNYMVPQVLVNVNHDMAIMREETFGPVVGIMPVSNDQDAIRLMNDSPYGLTASLWTRNLGDAEKLGQQLQTGTVFMNRCDYLDPALVWTGVKNTGRGGTLSELGYHSLTQPKSYHLKFDING